MRWSQTRINNALLDLDTAPQRAPFLAVLDVWSHREKVFMSMKTSRTTHCSEMHRERAHRSLAVNAGEGVGFQDIGSSFRASSKPLLRGSQTDKPLGANKSSAGSSRDRSPDGYSSSDDELLLSQGSSTSHVERVDGGCSSTESKRAPVSAVSSHDEDLSSDDELLLYSTDTSSQKNHARRRKLRTTENPRHVDVNGVSLPYHPDFQPKDYLRTLKFSKKKTNDPAGASSSLPIFATQEICKPISDDLTLHTGSSSSHTDQEIAKTPKRRPKPRIVYKPPPSPDATPRAQTLKTSRSARAGSTAPDGKPKPKPIPRFSSKCRKPQEFPMSLNAKENPRERGSSADRRTVQGKMTEMGSGLSGNEARDLGGGSSQPRSLQAGSSKGVNPAQLESTFPTLSPLSSPVHPSHSPRRKSKARSRPKDEEDPTVPSKTARPFPLSTQLLANVDHRSPARHASDNSDPEYGLESKRLKNSQAG